MIIISCIYTVLRIEPVMRFCVDWKTYNVVSYLHSPNQPTKKWKSHHPTTNCSFINIPWNTHERPILSRLMWKSFFMPMKSWHRSRTEILKPLSSHWNIGHPQDLLLSLVTFSSWFQLIPVCLLQPQLTVSTYCFWPSLVPFTLRCPLKGMPGDIGNGLSHCVA